MRSLLLAAGYGTRLYPLTKNRPKPLLPVGDRAILTRLVSSLEAVDEISRVHVVTNEKFIDHFQDWKQRLDTDLEVDVLNDGTDTPENRLGAIGDIQFVIEKTGYDGDFLVLAGDNVIEFDLNEFVDFFHKHGTSIGVKDMQEEDVSDYSVVELDENNRVVDFEEKPPNPMTSLISIGLYLFKSNHLPRIKEYLDMGENPDEPGYLIQWLHQVENVYGFEVEGPWYDIGDITSYNNANDFYEQN